MDISLTTPALLFPAIAILMLGYVNRYIGTAGVIRTFKKDYDGGYKHAQIVEQVKILRSRIELARYMIEFAAFALMLASGSMFLIYAGLQRAGNLSFGLSLVCMLVSLSLSMTETMLSNKSLSVEIEDILKKESANK